MLRNELTKVLANCWCKFFIVFIIYNGIQQFMDIVYIKPWVLKSLITSLKISRYPGCCWNVFIIGCKRSLPDKTGCTKNNGVFLFFITGFSDEMINKFPHPSHLSIPSRTSTYPYYPGQPYHRSLFPTLPTLWCFVNHTNFQDKNFSLQRNWLGIKLMTVVNLLCLQLAEIVVSCPTAKTKSNNWPLKNTKFTIELVTIGLALKLW